MSLASVDLLPNCPDQQSMCCSVVQYGHSDFKVGTASNDKKIVSLKYPS